MDKKFLDLADKSLVFRMMLLSGSKVDHINLLDRYENFMTHGACEPDKRCPCDEFCKCGECECEIFS